MPGHIFPATFLFQYELKNKINWSRKKTYSKLCKHFPFMMHCFDRFYYLSNKLCLFCETTFIIIALKENFWDQYPLKSIHFCNIVWKDMFNSLFTVKYVLNRVYGVKMIKIWFPPPPRYSWNTAKVGVKHQSIN